MELVSFKTRDNLLLDGAWYPANIKIGVLLMHGKGQNFYTSIVRWLAPFLNQLGFSCLSMNTRDHDHGEIDGIKQADFDIRAGINYLLSKNIEYVVVVGVSHGSNKVILSQYLIEIHKKILGVILLPVGGVKFHYPDIWENVLSSAKALYAPMLIIQAGDDEFIPHSKEIGGELIDASVNCQNKELFVIKGANHGFSNHKEVVLEIIKDWLVDVTNKIESINLEE